MEDPRPVSLIALPRSIARLPQVVSGFSSRPF